MFVMYSTYMDTNKVIDSEHNILYELPCLSCKCTYMKITLEVKWISTECSSFILI